MSLLIYALLLVSFHKLRKSEQIYLGVISFFVIRLVFESLLDYGTIFQQLTLYTILFPAIFIVFVRALCRSYNLDILEFLAKFYLAVYVIFMIIYGRGFSFSLNSVEMDDYGPFSGDSRVIHARSIFMMILPLLWFLNKYLKERVTSALLWFLFCVIVIVIHQHRSVWASSLFSLGIYFFIVVRNRIISLSKTLKIFFSAALGILLLAFVISQLFPDMLTFFGERFSEILDPTREDGTGKFRADQRRVYFPMVLERPFFGWTFEGFEMKNPLVDWWPEKTGQHFHEGFMEMLFYHGFLGLILKYFYLLYLGFKAFFRNLDEKSGILIAFTLAGLIFSFSYVLPLIFWGVVGICLYYLERTELSLQTKNAQNIQINITPKPNQKTIELINHN
ncbi:O-antigen ligase family protein [Pedobacter agri]|uniref:O-antigen ligase family protein n=2 Tax=Pedobacter agri TaxID=454586 RepID=A0A9X3I8J3_9SPHI|nr:O-antigen ligase family protein [Pedobacter agri]MCX3264044.1 O-antigen ligase family protein [Pedobacter agri]